MIQHWGQLLFLHWPIPAETLRPLVPPELDLDLRDDRAWIGIIPFTMWGIRAPGLPPIPGLSAMHEINVRTYVRCRGEPGVYFFSLDATNPVGVWGARRFWKLPYYHARISLERNRAGRIKYVSQRIHEGAAPATFHAIWTPGAPRPASTPGTLAHFLTERYQLFVAEPGRVFRCRIEHAPWPLRDAAVDDYRSTMISSLGLPEPAGAPVAYHADRLRVRVCRLQKFQ